MEKTKREVLKRLEKKKKDSYEAFLQNKIKIEDLKENLMTIEEVEKLIQNYSMRNILLDKREIRELAGKTLYISLPREIQNYGWNKSTEAKIFISQDGKRIILERVK